MTTFPQSSRLSTESAPAESAALPPTLLAKQEALLAQLGQAGRLMVAFSGGVDSSYLAWAAHRALGDDCLLVTAVSPSYPDSHRAMAEQIVEQFDMPHRFVDTHEMERSAYRANASDRCYHCKSELFETMDRLGSELGFDRVDISPRIDCASERSVQRAFLIPTKLSASASSMPWIAPGHRTQSPGSRAGMA